MYSFKNDYNSIGCKPILDNLIKYQDEQNVGYGEDYHTKEARKLVQKEIGNNNCGVYFLTGGTQTNMVLLSTILKPYEAVISCFTGHINVHETGAVEGTGHKILTATGKNGKINSNDVLQILKEHETVHQVVPKAVYISNPTELGTIYLKEELTSLYHTCKSNGLFLFVDGARLGSALTSKDNDMTIKELDKLCDAYYIGGTKNGSPIGEALVIHDPLIQKDFNFMVKNKGALLAKGYVCAICFETLFSNGLYYTLAQHANDCAQLIYCGLKDEVEFQFPFQTNQLFLKISNELEKKLKNDFLYEIQEQNKFSCVIRIVTTYNTDIKECERLVSLIKKYNILQN